MNPENQSDKSSNIAVRSDSNTQVSKPANILSFYKKDKDFSFLFQKAEKLAAAVYLLSNFFPNEEPLKWSLRNLCGKLLSQSIELKNDFSGTRASSENKLRDIVLEITSLLEVASYAQLISDMNVSILNREFQALLAYLQDTAERRDGQESKFLGEQFFAPNNIPPVRSDKENTGAPFSTHSNDQKSERFVQKDMPNIKDISAVHAQETKKLKEFSPVAVKKNKRQSIIINLLKRKKEIMVRDVAELIHDCSEKTLQRELLSLVSQGILNKEGERRWTRYSLAKGD